MKKRLFISFLAAMLLVLALAPAACALEDRHIADGSCGEGITWSLDGYTLTITGSGEMEDGAPWADHKDRIEHVVLTGGITKVGAEAFYQYDRLETVDFGDALVEIGEKAFLGCEDLDYIHLPASFRRFGAQSFRDCDSLKYVYCDGPMPRFSDSCLTTGNYISVFYPGNNPWPADAVYSLVHNFGGRLGVMMGSFDAAAVEENLEAIAATAPTEETEAGETEAPEETAAQTVAETTVETEPPQLIILTEPETEPTTEATEAPTQAPAETTVPETEAPTVPVLATEEPTFTLEFEEETEPVVSEQVESKSWIGMVMIAGVLTFLLAGAMIFRSVSHKGGRYR